MTIEFVTALLGGGLFFFGKKKTLEAGRLILVVSVVAWIVHEGARHGVVH